MPVVIDRRILYQAASPHLYHP